VGHNKHIQFLIVTGGAQLFDLIHIKRSDKFHKAEENIAAVAQVFRGFLSYLCPECFYIQTNKLTI
jgi:hypothetical protein